MVKIERIPPGKSGLEDTKKSKRLKSMNKKRCFYDGQEFDSLQDLAKFLRVTNMVIYHANRVGSYKGVEIESGK